jgi:multicomponent Na+:H+ antiporter subunit G
VIGGALHLRTSPDVWMLVLVGAFQLVTAPVTAHVVGRLAHRGDGGLRRDLLYVDELADRPDEADPGPDSQEESPPHRNGEAVGRSRRRGGAGSDGASLDSGE